MRWSVLWAGVFLTGCGLSPVAPTDDAGRGAAADAAVKDAAEPVDTSFVPEEIVPVAPGVASWALPRDEADPDRRAAFLLPWPNDLARNADGKVDLTVVPGVGTATVVAQYIRRYDGRFDGFSTVGATYFRFGGVVDPSTLPESADASRRGTSPVQIVDVDPASPERGRRVPAQWYFAEVPTRYWHADTLAVAPATGFPLRPHTRYAVVVTSALHPTGGGAFTRDADLDAVLSADGGDAAVAAARARYAPALEALAGVGVDRAQILTMSVFTTLDPTAEFFRAADWVRTEAPMPRVIDQAPSMTTSNYTLVRGHYGPNPNFQAGAIPYNDPGSGGFVLDAAGVAQVQRTETMRFALTIPLGVAPAGGWPLAIYAHGTGGDYQSFVDDRTALAAAAQGVAMLGFDQVFHGDRAPMGTNPETAFFNFVNPDAGRTNNLQAGLDLVQLGRLARNLTASVTADDGSVATVRFDPAHVMFFGHSQGGLNGPLWLAADDGASAGVLSGAGGAFNVSLLLKTRPVNIPSVLAGLVQAGPTELVPLHPVVTLLQLIVDQADPVNYGRFLLREPRDGMHAKHVFQTQGFVDHYAPPEGIAALALSIGLPLGGTVVHPEPAFPLTGLGTVTLPAHDNLVLGENRNVTAVWMQFNATGGRDGHFVVFSNPACRLRAAAFLGSAGHDTAGIPTVPDAYQ